MSDVSLFAPATLGPLQLRNRLVMAPMTRSRAGEGGVPNALMAEYYGQRAAAGLIVTEGTSPSPNGTGYPRIPGLWIAGPGGRLEARHRGGPRPRRPHLRPAHAHRPGGPPAQPAGRRRGAGPERGGRAGRDVHRRQGAAAPPGAARHDRRRGARRHRRARGRRAQRHRRRLRRRRAARRQRLPARAVPQPRHQPAHRRLGRLGREAARLRAGGGAAGGGRHRRRAGRHPALALRRQRRHGRLPGDRRDLPEAGAGARRHRPPVRPPRRPLGHGRAAGAGRAQAGAPEAPGRAPSSSPAASTGPAPRRRCARGAPTSSPSAGRSSPTRTW